MRPPMSLFVALGTLGLSATFGSVIPRGMAAPTTPSTVPAPAAPPTAPHRSVAELGTMFTPEIQSTVAACWEQGLVNLAATTTAEGWVMCGDGTAAEGITYPQYLDTVADVMAASTLVGLHTAMLNDPRLTPEIFSMFVTTEQGSTLLQTIVESAIVQNGIQPPNTPESSSILSDAVVERLVTNLSNPGRMGSLLGTPGQYSQVVGQFCTLPGMPLQEAQQQFGLDSIQLYAICIDESGAVGEAVQQLY